MQEILNMKILSTFLRHRKKDSPTYGINPTLGSSVANLSKPIVRSPK